MDLLEMFNMICEDLDAGEYKPAIFKKGTELPKELAIEEEAITFMIAQWMKQHDDQRYKKICDYLIIPKCQGKVKLKDFSFKEIAHFTCPESKK